MDKYLLEKLDKSELIETVIDLMEVKAMLEYSVDLYRQWHSDAKSQGDYSALWSTKHSRQTDKLLRLLSDINDSLNQEDDVVGDDTVIEEIVDLIMEADIVKLKDGKFTNKLTDSFRDIGEKGFKEHDAKREERKANDEKRKGTYNYQDPEARERFRQNNFYKY